MVSDSALDYLRLTATSGKGKVVILHKTVDAHKPDIMAIVGVFCARIPQPDNQSDFSFSVPEWQGTSPHQFVLCPKRGRE